MFAIIQTGGKQYKVSKGQTLEVEKIDQKEGEKINLSNVLLLNINSNTKIGTPLVEGAFVSAKIINHAKGEKLIIFKMKAKKRYQKKTGFRKSFTTLEILDIHETGGKVNSEEIKTEENAEKPKAPKAKTTKKKIAKE